LKIRAVIISRSEKRTAAFVKNDYRNIFNGKNKDSVEVAAFDAAEKLAENAG
jgi:hypothetical protein